MFRLAYHAATDLLAELALDSQAEDELWESLAAAAATASAEELCDAPFRPRQRLRRRTRFSDGSFPVFYSSLDPATAEAEVCHWFRSRAGRPQGTRLAYYQGLSCRFRGQEGDLRAKMDEWPDLKHDSDYTFCNALGREAHQMGIDGLVVPSVRHDGDNLPVFSREAISGAELNDVVVVIYDPDSGEVGVQRPHRPERPA